MTIDFICEVLAELFDSPCNYSPIDEQMFKDNYCESHCGKVENKDCWKRYFEKMWADRNTEPSDSEKPNNCETCKWWFGYCHLEECEYEPKDEPLTCDGNCWMKKQNGEWLCEHCQRKPKTEPQTDPCDGCVCDDGKHLMYCMNCKGIAWKTEPPKVEDEPQTGMSDMSEIDKMIKIVDGILGDDDLCGGCEYVIEGLTCAECRRKYADKIIKILRDMKHEPQTERSK